MRLSLPRLITMKPPVNGPSIEVVLAAGRRGELRERGMHRTAVVALGIVLEQQLPVGLHVVLDGACHLQVRQVEPREAAQQRRVCLGERLGIVGQVDEEEPLPAAPPRTAMQRIVGLVEALDVAVDGRADQPAIERVGPGMIGTLNRLGELPGVLLAEPGTAVAADVVVGPQGAATIAQHDDALACRPAAGNNPRVRDPVLPADAEPALREDALRFFLEDFGRHVIASRGSVRAPSMAICGGLEK